MDVESPCVNLQSELSAYLDGQLEDERRTEVLTHLASCGGCQSNMSDFKSLGGWLNKSADENMPEFSVFWQGLQSKLPGVCEVIQEDLSAYLDDELAPIASDGISQHLGSCSPCSNQYESLRSTSGILSKSMALPGDINIDLWAAIKSRLNEDCALIQGELSAFADQEVPLLRHRSITAHLLECPQCRLRFSDINKVSELLHQNYGPNIPDDFDLWPAIKNKLQVVPIDKNRQKRQVALPKKFYVVTAAAAAFVVTVISAIYIVSGGHGGQSVRPVTAEAYLMQSILSQPPRSAELAVYENP
jgi:anti-sigma factor RsiW